MYKSKNTLAANIERKAQPHNPRGNERGRKAKRPRNARHGQFPQFRRVSMKTLKLTGQFKRDMKRYKHRRTDSGT